MAASFQPRHGRVRGGRSVGTRSAGSAAVLDPLERRTLFAFGLTTTGTSYTVDTGANVVFSILRGGTVSSTIHLGDMTSVKFAGKEMLAPYSSSSRYSHYEQGLSSAAVISAKVDPNGQWIMVTCDDSAAASGGVIQYYVAKKGDNNIYMASLPTDVINGPGEGRYIAYLNRTIFTPEAASDNTGSTGAIEGSDVFGHADGTTTSKFFNDNRRMIDNVVHGVTGNASGTAVGAYMYMGNREHSAGGPFFKDIDFQSSDTQVEIYNCVFTGHTQTETYRQGLQGPYALQFTNGSAPTTPNYSFLEGVGISGLVPASRAGGAIGGVASGVPSGHDVVVGLANSSAQYWGRADSSGNYVISGVLPGTYTETLYDNELEVGTKTVTVTVGQTAKANIVDTFYTPSNAIFRIGTWDGTPLGFLNTDADPTTGLPKVSIEHPSDVRMTAWNSTPNFVVGTNTDSQWPAYQFMGVNNNQRITFNLTQAQVQNLTLRIGITWGFSGARPKITVNSGQSYAWTSTNPSASADLNSRGITRGTWRGVNQLYTFDVPASAFRAGTNTLDVPLISGSYVAGQTWLSPNVSYDAIDLAPTTTAYALAIASVTVTQGGTIGVNGTRTFTAVAKDAGGKVVPANIVWSAASGLIDQDGNYVAPATAGTDTVTAVATESGTAGYRNTSSKTTAFTGAVSATGTAALTVKTAPVVTSTVINDGSAQRSRVTSLTVNFDRGVDLAAGGITLWTRNADGTAGTQVTGYTTTAAAGNASYTLTFPIGTFAGASLADGNYELRVTATAVSSEGIALAASVSRTFYRLAGDNDGNRVVNIYDYLALQVAYNTAKGDSAYNAAFDLDGNGLINIYDYLTFQTQYNKTLTEPPALAAATASVATATTATPAATATPKTTATKVVATKAVKARVRA